MELLIGEVVEVVCWREVLSGVVLSTQVLHAFRADVAVVLAGYMVGHKINNDLQPCLVAALHEFLEFLHTSRNARGNIWVHVVVVFDGVSTAGFAFDHGVVVTWNAIGRIIRLRGMLDDAGVPDVCGTQFLDFVQRLRCEGFHGSAAIDSTCGVVLVHVGIAAKQSCEDLIDNRFLHFFRLGVGRTSLRQSHEESDASSPDEDVSFHYKSVAPWTTSPSTPLAILAIIPCRALPGPHSVNSVAPASTIACTSCVQRTLAVS